MNFRHVLKRPVERLVRWLVTQALFTMLKRARSGDSAEGAVILAQLYDLLDQGPYLCSVA
jgi:hypothetical protein